MTMDTLIRLAQAAADTGEVPIAAAVVAADGTVLAAAHNAVEAGHNATAHAELLAIAQACAARGSKYLQDCTLYVTLEPCAMCAQAISLAKIRKLVFGAYDPKGGAVEHGPRLYSQPTCHHAPEVIGGVMEVECGKLLVDFFAKKRL